MIAALALLLTLASAPPLGASEASPVVSLTLKEAVERARSVSPRLARLGSLEEAAHQALRGARAGRLPQVALGGGYARFSNVPPLVLTLPGAPPTTIFPNIPDNYRAHAGLTLPLFTSGRLESAIVATREEEARAHSDKDAGLGDLALETSTAYWRLVEARESARVFADALVAFDAHFKDARAREDVGMAARNEVLLVQVERERADLERLQAERAAEVAEADLRRLLELPSSARIECADPLKTGPQGAEDAEALTNRALEARPEVSSLRSEVRFLEASARVNRAATLPQASLDAAYDYANPNARILPPSPEWKGSWSVGLSLSATPFDGGRAAAAAAQARAQADALRHEVDEIQDRIRLEVVTRLLDVSTAQASIEVAERSVEAARENLRVSRERYREGVIASSDLLDAENALLRANLDATTALTDLRVASAGLDRAVGR